MKEVFLGSFCQQACQVVSHGKCRAPALFRTTGEAVFSSAPNQEVTCPTRRNKVKLLSPECGRSHRTTHRGNRQEELREGGQPASCLETCQGTPGEVLYNDCA